MKEILYILFNKKYGLVKIFSIILISVLYEPIYNLVVDSLTDKFSRNNILYFSRIIYIVLILLSIVLVRFKFINFARRNMESMDLLGTSVVQFGLLFCIVNYEVIFLQIYFGLMVCKINGISTGGALLVSILNAILIYMLGIFAGLKSHSRILGILICAFVGVLGALIGTGKLNYNVAYQFIMSEKVKYIILSEECFFLTIKFAATICLSAIIVTLLRNTDVDWDISSSSYRVNLIGDFIHKLSQCPINIRYSLGMYKSVDYTVWKIFSSVFFVLICAVTNLLL